MFLVMIIISVNDNRNHPDNNISTVVRCGCYAIFIKHASQMIYEVNLSILDMISQVLFLGFKLHTRIEICTG